MQEGMTTTLITTKEIVRKIKAKVSGQSTAYNEI
jgi:hypothetical protein